MTVDALKQDLVYHMVIELLAHQFAFPVKWTDTQDTLLQAKKVERLIEIGPSNTLTVMAKRTIEAKYKDQEAALSCKRQLLCVRSDTPEIYYSVQTQNEPASQAVPSSAQTIASETRPIATSKSPSRQAAHDHSDAESDLSHSLPSRSPDHKQPPVGNRNSIPDAPLPARQVLRALIAVKLKKSSKEISWSSTIKSLVGGRSTLENEIVGDLGSEFGHVPDRAEEIRLDQLAEDIQSSFSGMLGTLSLSLVNKMIAYKMPGGFGMTAIKQYLEGQWALPVSHQEGVLLLAVSAAPQSRIADESAAKSFIDDVVTEYAAENNIQFSMPDQTVSPQHANIDPKALEHIQDQQKDLSRKLIDVYCRSLGMDPVSAHGINTVLKDAVDQLQGELDRWTAEHGESYSSGIRPMFSTMRVRTYDSWWNWTTIDLLRTYHHLFCGHLAIGDPEVERVIDSIANRSGPKLLDVMEHLRKTSATLGDSKSAAMTFLDSLLLRCQESWQKAPVYSQEISSSAPKTSIDSDGCVHVTEVSRKGAASLRDYVNEITSSQGNGRDGETPIIYIRSRKKSGSFIDRDLTSAYMQELLLAASEGRSFQNKYVLLLGAGPGSIGSEILCGLLRGGARVVVTTSSFSPTTTQFFQRIYASHGSRGSKLLLASFNQGSVQDVESLVAWIYGAQDGPGWDLDFVIPFAAVSEAGRDIDSVDSKSELAHRIMLTNTIRLLGAVKRWKHDTGAHFHPAQVILPLSPNHGLFGNDGLYSESKIALETLFGKWQSEGWSDYLSICGASIGWTRCTGLMNGNDVVAEGIEGAGVRTFSREEMAFNLLCLMTPLMAELCQVGPIFADLSGRFDTVENFKDVVSEIRKAIYDESDILKAIKAEDDIECELLLEEGQSSRAAPAIHPRLSPSLGFPELASFETEVGDLGRHLHDMVDLDRVVVITGFAELGPYGNSRLRWEMESTGRFSAEGFVEIAWIMGLIKHHHGPLKGSRESYCGWVDSRTGEPVRGVDVQKNYGDHISKHIGIRAVEPALWGGYDPHKKQILQEVILSEDLPAFETSRENALEFRREHGSNVDISEVEGQYRVRFKKGAVMMVPKALDFENDVAGQIPTGWDPRTYGIPEDVISQVDPTTLYTLICTVEALLSSGITDPYEMYRYVHQAEVGNCIGTGIGGAVSLNKMHKRRYTDQAVQNDILQETFANTVTAWVNMLLLSSTGPIRTPVGACATSLESLDAAHDLIINGKARICLVGGVDDLEEDMAYEFANMKATVNAEDEYAKGRTPKDMSRPTASSRKGFVESQGCGVQVVMSARVALDMGVPIYGIVAFTGTASDKAGRSVPAPGKGVVGNVRELPGPHPSPLLDIGFRRRTLENRRRQAEEFRRSELGELEAKARQLMQEHQARGSAFDKEAFIRRQAQAVEAEALRQERDALRSLGNQFWQGDPHISPIRGALAMWGLTIDDVNVASFHGTSTVMNEKNEFEIMQRQLAHLGRERGNRLLGVFQKHLTGHSKGAAGAWMLNGCLQMVRSGYVPGNANADNIDGALEQFDYIAVPDRGIQTGGVTAFSVTSFGFGQKGTQAIGVHPRYLFATLDPTEYECYRAKVAKRKRVAQQFLEDGITGNALVVLKDEPPYGKDKDEFGVLLDPTARATLQKDTNSYKF